ncbi:MAG: hypothetical protein ACR2OX_01990 [Methyloligellaceae bacterium]
MLRVRTIAGCACVIAASAALMSLDVTFDGFKPSASNNGPQTSGILLGPGQDRSSPLAKIPKLQKFTAPAKTPAVKTLQRFATAPLEPVAQQEPETAKPSVPATSSVALLETDADDGVPLPVRAPHRRDQAQRIVTGIEPMSDDAILVDEELLDGQPGAGSITVAPDTPAYRKNPSPRLRKRAAFGAKRKVRRKKRKRYKDAPMPSHREPFHDDG